MSAPTAAERGDTVHVAVRRLIRAVCLVAVVGIVLGLAVLRQHIEPPDPAAPADEAPVAAPALDEVPAEVAVLAAEDARLRAVSLGPAVGTTRVGATVVLGPRPAAYGVDALVAAGALRRTGPGVVELVRPVVARRGARVALHLPATTLRMHSGARAHASLVTWGGDLALSGAPGRPLRLVGWDPRRKAADRETSDGRAYLLVKDGRLRLADVETDHLGYWSGRTGGLAVTGSPETSATADLVGVRVRASHIGLYLSGVERSVVRRTEVTAVERDGVEVTNRSHRVRLTGVSVDRSGGAAIKVGNGASRVVVERARLTRSGGYGLLVDGSPLADGPNSAGYSTTNYAGVVLRRSLVADNDGGGVLVLRLDGLQVDRSTLLADGTALAVRGPADGLVVDRSVVRSQGATGIVVEEVSGARVERSTVRARTTGVSLTDSTGEVRGNDIAVGTGTGVRVAGEDARAVVDGNAMTGRGPGAVADADGAEVQQGDTTGAWSYRPRAVLWLEEHGSALPGLLVLVVPAFGTVFVRRRRRGQRELRRLLEQALVARGREALAGYAPPRTQAPVGAAGSTFEAEPEAGPDVGPHVGPDVGPHVGPDVGGAGVPAADPAAPLGGRRFTGPQDFAVAAVLEAGYPVGDVARALRVPTARVRAWVEEARASADA
ncbi:hypothetical protein GGQ22_07655 [Nocardioides sp. zg-579]|uniref:Right handed beta helix domain-containing protein n=1 Tax=Nocardioides marmotae TaxID=2663857 RepID=A0A6I3JA62_9ACTN|nr:right-handed parallel beta-helix repeat-containing protein [Nocardioides marmotae]MCR6031319.1 hypothetical protein [Gordonia jinghuaiqii]MTB94958.1 hypothetical protein [Nocardioides marmotae]QKE02532.1 hypothetical protein HPC71_16755 [Nocardioides marmotae]